MIKPFVETYVASLPATKAGETWRDLGITPPTGVVQKTVEKGIAPKSQVAIVFSGPFAYNDANLLALRTMTMVLQGRLFDTIRQQLGGTYSIEVEPLTQKNPRPEFSVRISWACDPARVETLVQRVFDEIAFVKRTPLTYDQMTRVRAALRRDWDENSQNNGYLLNQIVRRYEDGNPEGVVQRLQCARSDQRAHRRGCPAGGSDISQHGQLRASDADAGEQIGQRSNGKGQRRGPAGDESTDAPH
jgi:zinc protease